MDDHEDELRTIALLRALIVQAIGGAHGVSRASELIVLGVHFFRQSNSDADPETISAWIDSLRRGLELLEAGDVSEEEIYVAAKKARKAFKKDATSESMQRDYHSMVEKAIAGTLFNVLGELVERRSLKLQDPEPETFDLILSIKGPPS